MSFPTVKTIHDEYFKPIEEFLGEGEEGIIKPDGSCISIPRSVIPVEEAGKILAIGDIHGDFGALLIALYKGGVIDMKGRWIGSDTIVVQVGDILDKGGRGVPEEDVADCKDDSEWRIILYLEYLNKEAIRDNGAVFLLLGNHEIMNFTGDMRYTTAATLAYFGGRNERIRVFKRGGIVAKKLACMTNTVMRIGNWVFAHAGITPKIMEYYSSLEDINGDIRDYILGNLELDENANPNSRMYKLYKLIGDKEGIVWTRIYGRDVDSSTCGVMKDTLRVVTGSDRGGMVVGHTVVDDIRGDCGGQLFQIDRGMSKGFGEKDKDDERVDYLKIIDGIPEPDKMKTDDIRDNLKERGLTSSGNRADIVKRLEDTIGLDKRVYLFVYGSLLNRQSRMKTIGRDVTSYGSNRGERLTLSRNSGFKLDFSHRVKAKRGNMTALALFYSDKPETIQGAILELTPEELELVDKREKGYLRTPIDWNHIKMKGLDKKLLSNYSLFTYYTDIPEEPNDEFPISVEYSNLIKTKK